MTSRSRSDGAFVASANAGVYQTYPVSDTNRTWTPPVPYGGYPNGTVKTMTDIVDVDYHERRKRGEVIFNPMVSHRRTASVSGGSLEYEETVPRGTAPQYLWAGRLTGDEFGHRVAVVLGADYEPPALVSASSIDNLCDEVSTDVWASVGTTRTQLLEDIAEFQQTLNMLKMPAASLFKWARKFDAGYFKALAQAKALGRRKATPGQLETFSTAVAALYLETRYGLKPIVSSIVGTLLALQETPVSDLWTTRANGKLSKDNGSSPQTFVQQVGQASVTIQVVTHHDVVVRGQSMDIVRMTLAKRLGISLSQVPVTMWNLVGLSFVADWFANIGSFIAAMTPKLDVRNRGNCLSVLDTRSAIITVTRCVGVGTCIVKVPLTGHGQISVRDYVRGPLRAPSLAIKSDWGFSKPARVGDAIALVAPRLLKLKNLAKGLKLDPSVYTD